MDAVEQLSQFVVWLLPRQGPIAVHPSRVNISVIHLRFHLTPCHSFLRLCGTRHCFHALVLAHHWIDEELVFVGIRHFFGKDGGKNRGAPLLQGRADPALALDHLLLVHLALLNDRRLDRLLDRIQRISLCLTYMLVVVRLLVDSELLQVLEVLNVLLGVSAQEWVSVDPAVQSYLVVDFNVILLDLMRRVPLDGRLDLGIDQVGVLAQDCLLIRLLILSREGPTHILPMHILLVLKWM